MALRARLEAGGQDYLAHGCVEGGEERVLRQDGRGCERVHEAALAGVCVADQCYQRHRQLSAAPPVLLPTLLHLRCSTKCIFRFTSTKLW